MGLQYIHSMYEYIAQFFINSQQTKELQLKFPDSEENFTLRMQKKNHVVAASSKGYQVLKEGKRVYVG